MPPIGPLQTSGTDLNAVCPHKYGCHSCHFQTPIPRQSFSWVSCPRRPSTCMTVAHGSIAIRAPRTGFKNLQVALLAASLFLSVAPGPHASLLPWPSCPLHFCCTYLVCQCLFLVPGNEHELRKQQERIQSAKMNQGLTQRLEKHTNLKNSWKQCPVSWTEPKGL